MNITTVLALILQEVPTIRQSVPAQSQVGTTFWSGPAASWAAAIGTLILAFVAVFQEWIKSWFFKPSLDLDVRVARPDAEKTRFDANTDVYYFRLAVSNTGRKAAEDVQVYVSAVKRKKADAKYETLDRFTPMALRWTHKGVSTIPFLLPKMPPAYCDLGHISDPERKVGTFERLPDVLDEQTVFAMETEVTPNSKANLLGPGEYRLYLKLAASNCPPHDFMVKLKMPGQWFADEERMFRDGIGLTLG
ncbi:MAG TPA: hypothetical protein VEI08_02105 [Candidatus Bathyarchaeia archaeon]|nr:hypothetical protein [Candidatus Bathyarchaeia archaeon]